MRNTTFRRHLSLLIALVFLLTSTGISAFAATGKNTTDTAAKIQFTVKPSFTSGERGTSVTTPRELRLVVPIPPNAPKERKFQVEITTGSSVSTISKFYLTSDKNVTRPAITTVASLQLTFNPIPGKPAATTQAATFYVGINGTSTLTAGERITIKATDLVNPNSSSVYDIIVSRSSGGGGGGGGSHPSKPPAKPSDKPKAPSSPSGPATGVGAFHDVKPTDWFYADVEFVVKNGLFHGVSATSFAPHTPMSRGMIVTALGRLNGVDANAHTSSSFGDVAAGQYYTAYVEWAKANGIVNGVGGNSFAPDRNVSRQDFAVILVRYSEFAKTKLPSTRQPVTFADETQIAGYAKNAVRTLYAGAIINGVGQNTFSPAASATRAEVAAMLHRFVEATK